MKKALLLVLCAAMIVTMAACGDAQTETPETTVAPTEATAAPIEAPTEVHTEAPTKPEPTAEEIYALAIDKLSELNSVTLEISTNSETVLGNQSFTESSLQTLIMQNIGEESFAASCQETTYLGSHFMKISEIYVDGNLYFYITPQGNMRASRVNYKTLMSAEEYTTRMIPAQLLNVDLYKRTETVGEDQLLFSETERLEAWLGIEDAIVKEGSGTVTLDENGCLSESTYRTVYQLGSAVVTCEVSVAVSTDEAEPIAAPKNADDYQLLEGSSYLGPYLLQRAKGYIRQMDIAEMTGVESVVSEATGWSYTNQQMTNLYVGLGQQLVKSDYAIQLFDIYTGEISYDVSLGEMYENGKYTYIDDNGESAEHEVPYPDYADLFWEEKMRGIPPQRAIDVYGLGYYGGMILLEYQIRPELDQEMSADVTGLLFEDVEMLNNQATEYRTDAAIGYIGFDAATGIPTAFGFDYIGVHTIGGVEYQLAYSLVRTFITGHESVYQTLTGEKMEDTLDLGGATPLFYKVTGANGQQMWLMGTIHVGDRRTENLPEEVWDAFDSADSLAVEFDVDAFIEQTENDPELAEQLQQMYIYSDGTTTLDHLSDPTLHEYALLRMKASGLLNSAVLVLKPSVWAQYFSEYNMNWNYELSSEEGMDQRLMDRAKEQGKKIIDVESGLFQLEMLTGFSDELQEMILASAVLTAPMHDVIATKELYELWCAGDEATLIDYLYREDGSEEEMTGEEKLLYEEYVKAMETDRNAAMLEAAKGYLESGDVVFYAVGLAHLIAEDGLVNTLKEAGYIVELVPYS